MLWRELHSGDGRQGGCGENCHDVGFEWIADGAQLPDDIEWHFVGALQSNKAKLAASKFTPMKSTSLA